MILRAYLEVAFAIADWFANPKRPPTKRCSSCGAVNEPDRRSCITCGGSF